MTHTFFVLRFAPLIVIDYDGGDCCSCTCVDTPNQKCGQYDGFACIDPAAQCVNDDDITVDMLENCQWVVGVGNGYCDPDMNIPECSEWWAYTRRLQTLMYVSVF